MINTDQYGFLVSESGDGMDSAMRAGVMGTFGNKPTSPLYEMDGMFRRHPLRVPSNNPLNCTRDQMIPLAAGLYFSGQTEICKRVFWATLKRFCFAQNIERDYPGTRKYPWPHVMTGGDPVDEGKLRMFDWADPMLPHHMMHLALCGRVRSMYWIGILGYPLLFLSILLNPENEDHEQNQLQTMCAVAGPWWVNFYRRTCTNWTRQTRYYWRQRNQYEYAQIIIDGINGWK